jgi:hypothetical protein
MIKRVMGIKQQKKIRASKEKEYIDVHLKTLNWSSPVLSPHKLWESTGDWDIICI